MPSLGEPRSPSPLRAGEEVGTCSLAPLPAPSQRHPPVAQPYSVGRAGSRRVDTRAGWGAGRRGQCDMGRRPRATQRELEAPLGPSMWTARSTEPPPPGDQRPPRPSSTGSEPAVTFHVRFLSLGVIQEDRGTGTLITGVPEPSPCPRPWPAPSRNQRECLGATRSHAASLPAPLAAAARLRPSSQSEDAGQREGCHLPRGACARAGRSRREGRRGFRPCCPGFPLVASEGLRAD